MQLSDLGSPILIQIIPKEGTLNVNQINTKDHTQIFV